MDWLSLAYEIIEVCVIPLLGVLTVYIVKYINAKSIEVQNKIDNDVVDKYIQMLNDTICDCVTATTQTYVEALKKENAFTKEAQVEAFNLTFNAVMSILNEDAKKYLTVVYGDLNIYIANKIEAEVQFSKK